jgi:hypothetical protein
MLLLQEVLLLLVVECSHLSCQLLDLRLLKQAGNPPHQQHQHQSKQRLHLSATNT